MQRYEMIIRKGRLFEQSACESVASFVMFAANSRVGMLWLNRMFTLTLHTDLRHSFSFYRLRSSQLLMSFQSLLCLQNSNFFTEWNRCVLWSHFKLNQRNEKFNFTRRIVIVTHISNQNGSFSYFECFPWCKLSEERTFFIDDKLVIQSSQTTDVSHQHF